MKRAKSTIPQVFLLVSLFSGLFLAKLLSGPKPIAWLHDYEAGMKQAEAEGKPVLIFFSGVD